MMRIPPLSLADAYALVALLFGSFFLIVTPPFGVGDETAHFERAYEIAAGRFLGAEGLPAGMQALIDDAFTQVKSGDATTAADLARWSSIPLQAQQITPYPDPIRAVLRLHSPLCYAHLAPVTAAGVALGAPPFAIFYAGRAIALFVGVFLVRAAIAGAPPAMRPPLVFLALLPTAVVYFAGFNIESLLVGLGFYYFALIAAHCAAPHQTLTRGDVLRLAGAGLLLGQFKTGYLLLPALAAILPATKFPSARRRFLILTLIIIPGMAISLGWAMIVKNAMLGDLVYSTMDGNHVEPSAQLAGVLADPVGYAGVVLRTMFASDAPGFAWQSLLALGGWTNIPVPAPALALLTIGLFAVFLSGERPPPAMATARARAAQLLIFGATGFAILTLVYFQWNGVGDPVIAGFQGRYLLAAAPLLIALAPVRLSLMAPPGRRAAAALGAPAIGLVAMAAAVAGRYW